MVPLFTAFIVRFLKDTAGAAAAAPPGFTPGGALSDEIIPDAAEAATNSSGFFSSI
jgi:hypothetical protein